MARKPRPTRPDDGRRVHEDALFAMEERIVVELCKHTDPHAVRNLVHASVLCWRFRTQIALKIKPPTDDKELMWWVQHALDTAERTIANPIPSPRNDLSDVPMPAREEMH